VDLHTRSETVKKRKITHATSKGGGVPARGKGKGNGGAFSLRQMHERGKRKNMKKEEGVRKKGGKNAAYSFTFFAGGRKNGEPFRERGGKTVWRGKREEGSLINSSRGKKKGAAFSLFFEREKGRKKKKENELSPLAESREQKREVRHLAS